ncbi:ubiquitin-protein ligase E3 [Schizosaccharomyces cryophilus OY26]|uniref:E3 ubiquitin-protein ligase listerin n=1 Tax=Schizosaccharomyces cryophilus (strain OY26 / ATCC MYA-4695 / CBS 11777 / NBRC 106824 / NRRL Y48691) TaxID=653667 RepID=S9W2S8_SCHCR|nr:ubiquitin-protein ligase E3 [Schizosaccharomyces cryophilus OY26]EPY52844.1 ubiquitin-protein ligase E3 [Schizosaccharomyces cryophilus OY26]
MKKSGFLHGQTSSPMQSLTGSFSSLQMDTGTNTSMVSTIFEPPDLTTIDADLLVVIKSLQKRDITTKCRALQDLIQWSKIAQFENEQFLDAWAVYFPRLAIETDRRVRQYAFTFTGLLSSNFQKKLAPWLKAYITPWMMGFFDVDKTVSFAARNSLSKLLSEDKWPHVWMKYGNVLVDNIVDILMYETVDSMSDLRFISNEDAESKYERTCACCFSGLSFLINQNLMNGVHPADGNTKSQSFHEHYLEAISVLLESKQLWELPSSSHGIIKLRLFQFLQNLMNFDKDFFSSYKGKILNLVPRIFSRSDSISCVSLLKMMSSLLTVYPSSSATLANHPKRPMRKCLQNLLRKRLALPNSGFYTTFMTFMTRFSAEQLVPSTDDLIEFSNAFMETAQQEQRVFATEVYSCHFEFLSFVFNTSLDSRIKDTVLEILKSMFVGYFEGTMIPQCPVFEFDKCLQSIFRKSEIFSNLWNEVLYNFYESHPVPDSSSFEVFSRSVNLAVQTALSYKNNNRSYDIEYQRNVRPCLQFLMQLSASENIQFASLAVSHLTKFCHIFEKTKFTQYVQSDLSEYLVNFLPSIILTQQTKPSYLDLLHEIVYLLRESDNIDNLWSSVIDQLMTEPLNTEVLNSLPLSFSDPRLRDKVPLVDSLVSYYDETVSNLIREKHYDWNLIKLTIDTKDILIPAKLVEKFLTLTSNNFQVELPLSVLENHLNVLCCAFKSLRHDLAEIFAQNESLYLLYPLLLIDPKFSSIDGHLRDSLIGLFNAECQMNDGFTNSLCKAVSDWSRKTVLEGKFDTHKAAQIVAELAKSHKSKIPLSLFLYTENFWISTLTPSVNYFAKTYFIDQAPCFGFSELIEKNQSDEVVDSKAIAQLFHASLYSLVFCEYDEMSSDLLLYISLSHAIFLIYVQNGIEIFSDIPIESANDFCQRCEKLFRRLFSLAPLDNSLTFYSNFLVQHQSSVGLAIRELIKIITSSSDVMSVCAGQAITNLLKIASSISVLSSDEFETLCSSLDIFASKSDILVVALLEGFKPLELDSGIVEKIRFRSASQLSGKLVSSASVTKALMTLNASTPTQDDSKPLLPITRCPLLLTSLTEWAIDNATKSLDLLSLSLLFQFLHRFVPSVQKFAGSYWNRIFELIKFTLKLSPVDIPMVKSMELYALRLYLTLTKIAEMNDDIYDGLVEHDDDIKYLGLKSFLSYHESNLKSSVTAGLCSTYLVRLLDNCSHKAIAKIPYQELYPNLLGFLDLSNEAMCMKLLQDKISSEIKDLTVYYMVESTSEPDVSFAPELLSILINYAENPLNILGEIDTIEPALRSYLLAWDLVFHHFEETTYQIKLALTEQLLSMDLVRPLLAIIVEILQLSYDRPVDVSNYPKTSYNLLDYASPLDRTRCLCTYIYYQCLRHLSSAVRGYWSEIKNRAFTYTVESFTESNVSPLLISASLDDVEKAISSSSFETSGDTVVKLNRNTKEISFIYHVDEHKLEMAIRIPLAYPLHQVQVEGIERVGVNERQWRAWILASQSILTSQNGSIIDALQLLKRNISMHFEGVEECAICYSVLSVERTLPNKRCSTCRHKFHASCLYKWFKSSNASRCPLCRSSFTFI